MSKDNIQQHPLKHLGIIIDGNRRWAKEHNLSSFQGHTQGLNRIEEIVQEAFDKGIKFVSLFVFSTDNWNRSHKEVQHLMKLFLLYFKKESQRLIKKGVCFKIAGRIDNPLSDSVQAAAKKLEENSKHNQGGSTVILCFNYGGHTEVLDMVKSIVNQNLNSEDIDLKTLQDNLYHPDVPNVDLIIRTSGEQRISGFQLFRANYSEFLFVNKNWPDFTKQDLNDALENYKNRQRRFGGN